MFSDALPPEERPVEFAGDNAQLLCPATKLLDAQVELAGPPLSSGTETVRLYGTVFVKLAVAAAALLIAPFADVALTLNPVLQLTVALAPTLLLADKSGVEKSDASAIEQLGPIVPLAVTVKESARAGCVPAMARNTDNRQAQAREITRVHNINVWACCPPVRPAPRRIVKQKLTDLD